MSLEDQCKLAAQDEESNQLFKEWEDATIGDGLDASNEWNHDIQELNSDTSNIVI